MSIERFFAFVESVMERLDQTILSKIFLDVDYLKDLLRISMVCRQWRTIIMEKSFLQKRFLQRRDKYLMYHWKFNDNFNFAWNSNEKMKIDKYYQTGHLQQDICFLGSCLLFDAHSSITIPLHRCLSERFAISLWVRWTFCDDRDYMNMFCRFKIQVLFTRGERYWISFYFNQDQV